jgi:catechol 2,3-dioxygenase-like lactoylglutathione lyase family enzyme
MIKALAHICILSRDLRATLDFYCGTLGFRKKFDFMKNDRLFGYYLQVDDTHFVEVFETQDAQPAASNQIIHFCLEVTDIDATRVALISKGIKVTEKKLGCDHSWQMWCKDPDGVDIEFQQYTAESSQYTGANCKVDW